MPSDDPIIIGEGSVAAKAASKVIVPHWRDVFKRWSFWLGVIGSGVTTFALYAPDVALQVWLSMPADLKEVLPPNFVRWFGLALFISSNIAAFIKQRSLSGAKS